MDQCGPKIATRVILSNYRSYNSQIRSEPRGYCLHIHHSVEIGHSDAVVLRYSLKANVKEPVSSVSRCHNIRKDGRVRPRAHWVVF